jgi:transcriptional regulator with XRE-family HTH domain
MFGERLKTLRKNKGLSQKELGDLFDLGQTTIANYEKNIRFPSPVVLVQIADYFGCTLDELMGRDQDEIELFSDDELMEMTEKVRALALKEDEKQLRSIFADMSLSVGRLIQLYEKVMMPVMVHIGDLWQDGQITIAK